MAKTANTHNRTLWSNEASSSQPTPIQPQSHRLFGTYMNQIATYEDANTAWLSTDTMLSWVTTSVYEKFAGGGYMSGVKLCRGYSTPERPKDKNIKEKVSKDDSHSGKLATTSQEQLEKSMKRRSAPPTTNVPDEQNTDNSQRPTNETEEPRARLQRQLSSLMETDSRNLPDAHDELQRQEEQEMQGYHSQKGESQGRQIDHLILVTHGIGQRLSLR